jgi:hypothetical protein
MNAFTIYESSSDNSSEYSDNSSEYSDCSEDSELTTVSDNCSEYSDWSEESELTTVSDNCSEYSDCSEDSELTTASEEVRNRSMPTRSFSELLELEALNRSVNLMYMMHPERFVSVK